MGRYSRIHPLDRKPYPYLCLDENLLSAHITTVSCLADTRPNTPRVKLPRLVPPHSGIHDVPSSISMHGSSPRECCSLSSIDDLPHLPTDSSVADDSTGPSPPQKIELPRNVTWDSEGFWAKNGMNCSWKGDGYASGKDIIAQRQPCPFGNLPPRMNERNSETTFPDCQAPSSAVTVHDHIKIKLGAGFDVKEVVTGFETPWVVIGNVPACTTVQEMSNVLRSAGKVQELKMPTTISNATMTVKVRFSSFPEASRACGHLKEKKIHGSQLSPRLPFSPAKANNLRLLDTSVRISWELPGKTGYCGYPSMKQANAALNSARVPFRDRYINAQIHRGIPALGVVTVCFRHLPLDADEKEMERFAQPEEVMWESPKHPVMSLSTAAQCIEKHLFETTQCREFDVLAPPYYAGFARAYAQYASPKDARVACLSLHGRIVPCNGHIRIYAQHMKTIYYHLSAEVFDKVSKDISALRATITTVGAKNTTLSITPRKYEHGSQIQLSGENLKELGQLKAELEKILSGEVIRENGRAIWDDYFARPAGVQFLLDLGYSYPMIRIQKSLSKRMIRLFGASDQRSRARKAIVDKVHQLNSRQVHTIHLIGRLIGPFMNNELTALQKDLGSETVVFHRWSRTLSVYGDMKTYALAKAAVSQFYDRVRGEKPRATSSAECPVCFDTPIAAVKLPCGHIWCRVCLENYLKASSDRRYFPIVCLGDEAKCTARIPLSVASDILTLQDFEALAEYALSAHVQKHPDEFHYCPSPDCPQIYRTAPPGGDTFLQCPSCLVRICPHCHSEAHDGLACVVSDGRDGLFKEWVNAHDVKSCPGCKISIERAEGCNHMTCTQCQTHICWVCMETFPRGEGIYGHMHSAHGGFGLEPGA